MEMEMVTIEDLAMARSKEEGYFCDSYATEWSSEMRMAIALMKPFSSPSLNSVFMPSEVAAAIASLSPSQMEVEMAEALVASSDVRSLELMMFLWKPLKVCKGKKDTRDMASLDMETEMVLLQQAEL
eukprot:c10090_g1_i1 orf=393-773(-)